MCTYAQSFLWLIYNSLTMVAQNLTNGSAVHNCGLMVHNITQVRDCRWNLYLLPSDGCEESQQCKGKAVCLGYKLFEMTELVKFAHYSLFYLTSINFFSVWSCKLVEKCRIKKERQIKHEWQGVVLFQRSLLRFHQIKLPKCYETKVQQRKRILDLQDIIHQAA